MSVNEKSSTEIDAVAYLQNRQRMRPELLEPYAGQVVALNVECTKVLASGPDLATAAANLDALGIPGNSVAWVWVPEANVESWL
jgi:hypothetical protein